MPELAEVRYFARCWTPGIGGRVAAVDAPPSRVFQKTDPGILRERLTGRTLKTCESRGKQASFRFSGGLRLGIHLGMSGKLFVESRRAETLRFESENGRESQPHPRHDRLRLQLETGECLVYHDMRMLGGVRLDTDPPSPDWWSEAGPDPADREYDAGRFIAALHKAARAPVKPLLLRQDLVPGIGNWMADEILFRAGIRPDRPAGSLTDTEIRRLEKALREVSRAALETIGEGVPPPADWLFHRRWADGGLCPITHSPLVRIKIAGRTACFSPGRQR